MRGRGSAAAAAVAVVALVVPVSLAALAGIGPGPAPGPQDASVLGPTKMVPPGDPVAAAALTCTDPAPPAEAITASVVAARMCDTDDGVASWFAPQDGLHADLAPLVAVLAGADPVPETSGSGDRHYCTDDGGYGFDLRLALSSGEVFSVVGDTGGCSTVVVGGRELVGSDEVLATFLDLLAEQRRTTEPPASVDRLDLGCRSTDPPQDHRLSLIGDPADLVEAVTCWRPNADDVPPWRSRVEVPPRQLVTLVDDLAENARLAPGFGEPDCPGGVDDYYWQDVVGLTRWGDVVAVRGVCREFLAAPAEFWQSDPDQTGASQQPFWHPSPAAQRILDDLRR